MRVDLSGVALAARWYDALTGRWLSADTIVPGAGNPQSLNRYTYVNNNPLAYIDPSGHVAWVPLGAAVGALIGAGIGYGTQVAANLNRGMDLGRALTTDLDAAKIVRGAVTGAVIGTGVGAVASLVAAGAATASVATAGTAATTAVTAAVSDDGGAGEAQAARAVIADTNLIYGRMVQPGEAVITPDTVRELAKYGRTALASGFGQISAETEPGFAQTQAYIQRFLPAARGLVGDTYGLATAAMKGGTFLTADKATIFKPLADAISAGLIDGQLGVDWLRVYVPQFGHFTVRLISQSGG